MQTITTIGLDIAKSVFQVHGVDAAGEVVIRRQLKRRYVLAFFQKLSPCLVGIEACASSHYWSRELQDLLLEPAQLCPERDQTRAGYLRNSPITWIGDDIEQFFDTLAPHRRDDPELGEMSTDRIDHCGLLADEQVTRAMQHQAALLLRRLGLDEPHVGPRDRLADCLRVCGIVLLPFDVGFYISRRH